MPDEDPAPSPSCCPLHNLIIRRCLSPISSSHFSISEDMIEKKLFSHFHPNPRLLQSTLQSLYISECTHCTEALEGTQEEEDKRTAVAVPSHCPTRAPCTQDDGSSPLVLRRGLPCLRASTRPWRATGHLSPCSASRGFQQLLRRAGGSETCRPCREIGLFSCNPCNNGQLISIAVYQPIHSTTVLSRCRLLFFSLPRFTVL